MRFPAMIGFMTILAGFLFDVPCRAAAPNDQRSKVIERNVPAGLATILCNRHATAIDFLGYGFFDAQVEVVSLKPKNSTKKLNADEIRSRAVKLALTNGQLGYASGVCTDGSGWAMSLPNGDGFALDGRQIKIPRSLPTVCVPGSIKAFFAPENQGRSLALKIDKSLMAEVPDKKGYAAVTCVFRSDSVAGPRELALIPFFGARSDPRDLGQVLLTKSTNNLADWINGVRRRENLPGLPIDRSMTEAANGLKRRRDVRHNFDNLFSARENLKRKGFDLLGENRVRGQDLAELVGLLWMSPVHRDLILNPSAEVMGVVESKDDQGLFAVIIAGKKSVGNVAKNPSTVR